MKCELRLLGICVCKFTCVVSLSQVSATHYTEIWMAGMVGWLLRISSEDGVKCEKDSGLSCLKAVSCDMY
jgi:hypothetical protein